MNVPTLVLFQIYIYDPVLTHEATHQPSTSDFKSQSIDTSTVDSFTYLFLLTYNCGVSPFSTCGFRQGLRVFLLVSLSCQTNSTYLQCEEL